jgi:hypothetical protein
MTPRILDDLGGYGMSEDYNLLWTEVPEEHELTPTPAQRNCPSINTTTKKKTTSPQTELSLPRGVIGHDAEVKKVCCVCLVLVNRSLTKETMMPMFAKLEPQRRILNRKQHKEPRLFVDVNQT